MKDKKYIHEYIIQIMICNTKITQYEKRFNKRNLPNTLFFILQIVDNAPHVRTELVCYVNTLLFWQQRTARGQQLACAYLIATRVHGAREHGALSRSGLREGNNRRVHT
jgi:hypothetical protein